MYELQDVFDEIDQCIDLEDLQKLEGRLKASTLTKTFWKQRKIALSGKEELRSKKAKLKCNEIAKQYGATIPVSRRIHEFDSPHGFWGIHISSHSRIGTGCTIFQHVVIGANTLPDSKNAGVPTIGNNVYIGAGAMVIGNVHVGDNVRIGANAIVTKDIPDNCVVVSPGVKLIQKDEPMDNRFVSVAEYRKMLEAE